MAETDDAFSFTVRGQLADARRVGGPGGGQVAAFVAGGLDFLGNTGNYVDYRSAESYIDLFEGQLCMSADLGDGSRWGRRSSAARSCSSST